MYFQINSNQYDNYENSLLSFKSNFLSKFGQNNISKKKHHQQQQQQQQQLQLQQKLQLQLQQQQLQQQQQQRNNKNSSFTGKNINKLIINNNNNNNNYFNRTLNFIKIFNYNKINFIKTNNYLMFIFVIIFCGLLNSVKCENDHQLNNKNNNNNPNIYNNTNNNNNNKLTNLKIVNKLNINNNNNSNNSNKSFRLLNSSSDISENISIKNNLNNNLQNDNKLLNLNYIDNTTLILNDIIETDDNDLNNINNKEYYESFSKLHNSVNYRKQPIYLNEFAVHIPNGHITADDVAEKYGFNNMGQIGSLKNYYLFHHRHISKRSIHQSDSHHSALKSEPEVRWWQQQHEKIRKKRDYNSELSGSSLFKLMPNGYRNSPSYPLPLSSGFDSSFSSSGIGSEIDPNGYQSASLLHDVAPQSRLHYRAATPHNFFPDPLFKEQWYLNSGAKDGLDMNVGPAWQKGYTGKGVVVSILDDGIQTNHPDLAQNYDKDASYDINGNDSDPMPQDNGDNKHGTRCAGEVAGVAFNSFCGVGVAYNSSIGGVRMLDGSVNDAVEAKALSLNPQHIDIYSASWGPEDDGSTVDGPGPLARRAFIYGVTSGRGGKGSIFVWASGNGGRYTDSCNCDGYTNSIFTLSISSATQGGFKPWYLEECSSTLATTYSSGTPGHDKSVATVDMDGRLRPDHICTVEHTGTSASAPLAAGISALALEANPNLTWRDMQYLVVMTSRPEPLEKESGWILNGVKRKFSHKFGYGLMDAGSMVSLAEQWSTVPPQHICKSRENNEDRPIEGTYGYTLQTHMDVNGCAGTINEVRYLEHVQCKITLRFFPRGNLRILLTSPMGTTSTLLFERPRDIVKSNFDDWPFLSVHFWGEKAEGRWTLQVINGGRRRVNQPGILSKWQLIFYGTSVNPVRLKGDNQNNGRRQPGINPFVFPTDSDLGQIAYNSDPYSGYLNYQNLFTGAGSSPEKAVATMDGHNIPTPQRQTVMADSNNKLVVHDCDPECDSQGCYGRGPTQCVACKHYRLDNTCVSRCPPRSFPNQGGVCWPCHESCETCAGAGQDSCLTCAPAHLHVTDLAVCLQVCPDGYYENDENSTCVPCESNCASCQDRPDFCLSCDHHLVMHEHKCYSACPIHTYETEDYNCASCHSSCATCNGSSETQCITCRSGRFASEGKCLNSCPDGFYGDKKRLECMQCPKGCDTCTTNGFCLTCKENWTKNKKGKCIANGSEKCNESEYYNNGICHPCHSTCETCDGPTETNCLSCQSSLLLQTNRCVNSCDDGFYMEAGVCAKCLHTCTQCVSRTNCTKCAKGLQLQSGECRTTCADGYYSDRGTCSKCYLSCHTCSGPRRDQCVQCPKGWQLAGGECHPECPEGFYKSDFGCQKCHHYCKTCNDAGPLACTSCPSHFMLDGGLCMECLGSQYYDSPTQTCKTCHESCRTCSGSGQYSCQDCAFPLHLDRLNNQCVPCCPSDVVPENQSCCRCDNNTGGCTNASPAGKRRIAAGDEQSFRDDANNLEGDSNNLSKFLSNLGSPISAITAIAVAGCLLIITIFAVIFAVLQRNSYNSKGYLKNNRIHSGIKYNKLSTDTKSGNNDENDINTSNNLNDENYNDENEILLETTETTSTNLINGKNPQLSFKLNKILENNYCETADNIDDNNDDENDNEIIYCQQNYDIAGKSTNLIKSNYNIQNEISNLNEYNNSDNISNYNNKLSESNNINPIIRIPISKNKFGANKYITQSDDEFNPRT